MKDYERLTDRDDDGIPYVKCADCYIRDKCDLTKEVCYQELQDRLAELEDKIERGELISTQLKDSSEQEFAFFVNHNRSVSKLFADELKARLQDAVTLGNITRKVYDVIESEINYCLGEVNNETNED